MEMDSQMSTMQMRTASTIWRDTLNRGSHQPAVKSGGPAGGRGVGRQRGGVKEGGVGEGRRQRRLGQAMDVLGRRHWTELGWLVGEGTCLEGAGQVSGGAVC